MDWNYSKEKILVFGVDDYVFADMFVSIVIGFDNRNVITEYLKGLVYQMLKELMQNKLIDVFLLQNKIENNKMIVESVLFEYNCDEDIELFLHRIDNVWRKLDYKFPQANQLFWLTTNEIGERLIEMGG